MRKILLAYDGGEPAQRALATTAELARAFEAEVAVISVVPFHPWTEAPIDTWDDASVHARELVEAQQRLREHGIDRLTLDVRHEALVHARARRTHECEARAHRSVPFIRRPSAFAISSFESRSAIACRLSAFLRPRATPSSTFTRPSLK